MATRIQNCFQCLRVWSSHPNSTLTFLPEVHCHSINGSDLPHATHLLFLSALSTALSALGPLLVLVASLRIPRTSVRPPAARRSARGTPPSRPCTTELSCLWLLALAPFALGLIGIVWTLTTPVATFVAAKAFGILHGLFDLLVTLARVSRLFTRRTKPAGLTSRCPSLLRRLESGHHVEVSVSRLGQESGSLLDSVLDALVVGPFFLVLGLRLLLSRLAVVLGVLFVVGRLFLLRILRLELLVIRVLRLPHSNIGRATFSSPATSSSAPGRWPAARTVRLPRKQLDHRMLHSMRLPRQVSSTEDPRTRVVSQA